MFELDSSLPAKNSLLISCWFFQDEEEVVPEAISHELDESIPDAVASKDPSRCVNVEAKLVLEQFFFEFFRVSFIRIFLEF